MSQAVHGQITAGGSLNLLDVTSCVEPVQFGRRRLSSGNFHPAFATEQSEGSQPLPGQGGALGSERTIRRITQPFDFGRVQESQFAVAHAQTPRCSAEHMWTRGSDSAGGQGHCVARPRRSIVPPLIVCSRFKAISSCPVPGLLPSKGTPRPAASCDAIPPGGKPTHRRPHLLSHAQGAAPQPVARPVRTADTDCECTRSATLKS